VVDSVALDVNHGFMFCLCKGDALASGNQKVPWKVFADFVWRDSWHVLRDVFKILAEKKARRVLVHSILGLPVFAVFWQRGDRAL
jgi:hypothetical protein